jgi:hypothetical protein
MEQRISIRETEYGSRFDWRRNGLEGEQALNIFPFVQSRNTTYKSSQNGQRAGGRDHGSGKGEVV